MAYVIFVWKEYFRTDKYRFDKGDEFFVDLIDYLIFDFRFGDFVEVGWHR